MNKPGNINKPGREPMRICRRLPIAVLLLMAAAYSGLCAAAAITVHADRNPAVLQESFQLIFEATGEVDADPDFSPLNKDFQVLSTSVSTSMSIVNTQITRTKQWRLTLLPLTAGNLTIPAISFGKDQSPPTSLTVIQAGSGSAGQYAPDIFIDVKVVPESAYVQAEMIYTVKLYRAVATSNETLSEPAASQGSAIIEPLDADRSYDAFVRGRRYAVFERSYGVYPQVSGNLLIQPIRFQAQLSTASSFRLDPFGAGAKTVVRQSEPVRLQVKPIPDGYQGGHWLPAADVKITEKWSKNPLELLSNEPVTRTITLTAQGLTASQLPEILELLPAGFKQYPDLPELENRKSADGITGVRQQKNAIIPAHAGEYTLPEIALPWWNTDTQAMEYARLPERRIQVKAAAPGTPDLPAPAIGASPDAPQTAPETAQTAVDETALAPDVARWQWLAGILAVVWLVTLGYALKNRRRRQTGASQAQTDNTRGARKALKQACLDDDPQRAKTALLQWADLAGAPAASLGDLEKQSSERLAAEIRNLSRRLYSRATEPWRGEPLWQAFVQEEKSAAADKPATRGKLEPLFRL